MKNLHKDLMFAVYAIDTSEATEGSGPSMKDALIEQ